MIGESVYEQMRWRKGQNVLDEMKRVRIYDYQECDAIERKDGFPIETYCSIVCLQKDKIVYGLGNRFVAVFEWH